MPAQPTPPFLPSARPGSVRLVVALALSLTLVACLRPAAVSRPALATDAASLDATGQGGAVASAEPAATSAGLAILRSGGDAVDAAVAVALALAVVHPQAGNLGGGGFAVVRQGGTALALDFRETAPAAARQDIYLGPDGKPLPEASWVGPLAAGVPGTPSGLFELHRRLGRLSWPEVVGPALRLARDGFAVSGRLHDAIADERDILSRFPETASLWLPGGEPPAPGTVVRLPDLAATLEAYAERGPASITSGSLAQRIETASRSHGGILTAADLTAYRPLWRDPLRTRAFGWEIAAMPLPSSGGLIVAESCALLERTGWRSLPPRGADRDHLLVEAWRRAYADRFVLGDPETSRAGPRQLLDPAWIETRSSGIDRSRATPSLEVRPWPGSDPVRLGTARREPAETTHLSVVDGSGDMVALTTTLNGWFGCGLMVPGAGFLLNNEMDDFTTAPGLPNAYGLVQGDANAVRPGKRMLSSMNPMIAWRDDEAIALGSPGGSRIPTATLQVLLALIVDREPLRQAVERPRFHHQWLPDQIIAEEGAFMPEVAAELARRGHAIKPASWRIGEVDVVRRRAGGDVESVADRRGPGGAGVTEPRAED